MVFQPTDEQRTACAAAADLLAAQAEGLRLTGSVTTVSAIAHYVSTLRRIASAPEATVAAKDKVEIEQATFVLEGLRDGLLTAEFKDRAEKINRVIRALNEIAAGYNAAAS
jgi:hypothetical protein